MNATKKLIKKLNEALATKGVRVTVDSGRFKGKTGVVEFVDNEDHTAIVKLDGESDGRLFSLDDLTPRFDA